jgi:hypothetical protein
LSAPIPLQAGRFYTVKMEYFQHLGGDYYSLSWGSDHVAKQLVPTGVMFANGLAPIITMQPYDTYVMPGDPASFTIMATGAQPLGYQWFLIDTNNVDQPIPGATDPTLTLPSVQAADGLNYYYVVVTNSYGQTNSEGAHVFPYNTSVVAIVPHSQTNFLGSTVAFTYRASGLPYYGGDPWYNVVAWYFNDNEIPDSAGLQTLTLTNVQPTKAGRYSVEVQGNGWDTTSDYAFLTVRTNRPTGANFTAINRLPNQTVQLTATGTVDAVYYIDAITNIVSPSWMAATNWAQVTKVTNTTGTFHYTEPATNGFRYFYRTRLGP